MARIGMYAVVKTIATILSLLFFIDRAGRRKLLITSSIGTSLALWYIGGFVTAKHIDLMRPQAKSVAGWVAIVCVYVYAVCISAEEWERTQTDDENRHSSPLRGME